VARHRTDGGDNFLVGHLLRGSDKPGIVAISENCPALFRIAAERRNQFGSFSRVEGSKVHRYISFAWLMSQKLPLFFFTANPMPPNAVSRKALS
jgi:hypothetical protein